MALKPADPRDAPLGFFATGISVFMLWNLATLIGALAGNAIGDPRPTGSTPRCRLPSSPCCGRASTRPAPD